MPKKLFTQSLILSSLLLPNLAIANGFDKNDGSIENKYYDGDGLNNLWVFGDSLSSQSLGELVSSGRENVWKGRYANGKIWVDWLGETSRIRTNEYKNFATPGAKSDENANIQLHPITGKPWNDYNPWKKNWQNMGVKSQISLAKKAGLKFGENDLTTVFVGSNDYMSFIELNTTNLTVKAFNSDNDIDTTTTKVVDNTIHSINELKSMNAKNILVPSSVNMTRIPAILGAIAKQSDVATWQQKSDKYWNDYHTKLKQKLIKFSNDNEDISLYYADTMAMYNYLVQNSEVFGIPQANINKVCYKELEKELEKEKKLKTGTDLDKNDCSKYLSWDGVHPTSEVHKIVATGINSVLQIPRFNTMLVRNINQQTQSILDLTNPSIDALANNNSKKFTINSSAFQGGFSKAKNEASDGIMQQTSDRFSISAQYALSSAIGISIGYLHNTTETNESAKHETTQSTTLLSLYGVKQINQASHISTQGYFAYTAVPKIQRMVMLNKVAMSGETKAYTFGGNINYNYNITKSITTYAGLSYVKTKLKGYAETTNLKTGLGVEVDDINLNRTYITTGINQNLVLSEKIQYGWNVGIEYDLKNKLDKYTFKSINSLVPTNIRQQELDQSALVLGANTKINISAMQNVGLFLNSRLYKDGNSFTVGGSYNIKF